MHHCEQLGGNSASAAAATGGKVVVVVVVVVLLLVGAGAGVGVLFGVGVGVAPQWRMATGVHWTAVAVRARWVMVDGGGRGWVIVGEGG